MPTPDQLASIEIDLSLGYYPSAPALSPEDLQRTIRAGSNVWLRPKGKIEVANGLLELSTTNVGARIFAADTQRAVIDGGLVGSRLPYAGLLRYQNAVLFFLSENTSSQVYLNETAVAGLTTSASAGRLRIGIPDGLGGHTTVDAGFDKLPAPSLTITASAGVKDMKGAIGIAFSRWRSKTNAIGPPSDIVYSNIPPNTNSTIGFGFPALVSGQDGWVVSGTRWGDRSGVLRVVRYIYSAPVGTFTATNGSPTLTLGIGTRWNRDLARRDGIIIDGVLYQISSITSDTELILTGNFTGSTGSGKTLTVNGPNCEWYDGELGALVNRDIQKPPRAAGVLQYGGRVFIWGVGDTTVLDGALSTGPAILAMEENNPEHCGRLAIVAQSGSDLVNVLAGDGPMYLMTTTSLEVVNFTGDGQTPYTIRVVAEPGFKAATNGVLYKDWFYGFNNRPLRTRARENIDVQFAEPVWGDMASWDAARVIVAVDPKNEAVLYMYDNGSTTVVIPWLTQQERWNPPLNFGARITDTQVVNGVLDVTYLTGGNYRVNQWEGGSGIGGTRYVASQYYDTNSLQRGRLKRLVATGKMGSVSVYAAIPDSPVPDVSNLGAADATFLLSDVSKTEPEIHTNIEGRALAFRADFSSNDGSFDKLMARGTPRSEGR